MSEWSHSVCCRVDPAEGDTLTSELQRWTPADSLWPAGSSCNSLKRIRLPPHQSSCCPHTHTHSKHTFVISETVKQRHRVPSHVMLEAVMFLMMPWPLSWSFSFLPPDVFLQDHVTARQNAPQRSLSSQQEAAVRMLFTRPLQQVLEEESGEKNQQKFTRKIGTLFRLSPDFFNSNQHKPS